MYKEGFCKFLQKNIHILRIFENGNFDGRAAEIADFLELNS